MDRFQPLKDKSSAMMSAMFRAGFRNENRADTVRAIIDEMKRINIPLEERDFVGSYMMSRLGYGGGL